MVNLDNLYVVLVSMQHLGLQSHYLKLTESHGDGTVSGIVVVPHPTDGWVPVADDLTGNYAGGWCWSHQIVERNCCPVEAARMRPELVETRSRSERRAELREFRSAIKARQAARQAAESQPSPYADPFELRSEDIDFLAMLADAQGE